MTVSQVKYGAERFCICSTVQSRHWSFFRFRIVILELTRHLQAHPYQQTFAHKAHLPARYITFQASQNFALPLITEKPELLNPQVHPPLEFTVHN